ncbi:hypothetical protein [Bifidobacterium aerophilum]|uniref:PD-(D/E)XK endonuclease-like domain-containing protein n=1 Tax=Bifidobacterium aerophilum TaxID=1798155 RepID=A0A6N9Z929_9BIFI|nr:hypothetical protein [Bifidobacterium aerophilum]NEG90585.1 hypothetical protein [Bifidobacterium aerophilum]
MSDATPIDLQQPQPATQPILQPSAPPKVQVDAMNAPRYWAEIRSIIETSLANAPRELQREIGPSELGVTCIHCLAAKLAGWPKREPRDKGWTPALGTFMHEHLQRLFDQRDDKIAGTDTRRWTAELKVPVGQISGLAGGTRVTGSIDLYDQANMLTVDWKLVGDWSLKRKRAKGMPQQYVIQASLYGIGLRNKGLPVEWSAIYAMPKTGRNGLADTVVYETRFDPEPGQWALQRASTLCTLLDLIETQQGEAGRDAWIASLPRDPDECFDCHDNTYQETDLKGDMWTANHPHKLDSYRPFATLIQPTYPSSQNQ